MDCLGIILAGGQSSRMGENKAFLEINGKSMLENCQQLLAQCQLENIMISGSNSGGIEDLVVQGGPLAGIYTLIQKYQPKSVLVLPIDMPFITAEHLQELKKKGSLAIKATHFDKCSLPAFIPVNSLLSEFLQQKFTSLAFLDTGKGPSFKQIFKLTDAQALPIADRDVLININTPEQWREAKNSL